MCKPAPTTSTVLEKAEAIDNSNTTEYSLVSIPLHGPTATLIFGVIIGLLLLLAFYKMCVHWRKSKAPFRMYSRPALPGSLEASRSRGVPTMTMLSYPQDISLKMNEGRGSCLVQPEVHNGYMGQHAGAQARFSHEIASAPSFQGLKRGASSATLDEQQCV